MTRRVCPRCLTDVAHLSKRAIYCSVNCQRRVENKRYRTKHDERLKEYRNVRYKFRHAAYKIAIENGFTEPIPDSNAQQRIGSIYHQIFSEKGTIMIGSPGTGTGPAGSKTDSILTVDEFLADIKESHPDLDQEEFCRTAVRELLSHVIADDPYVVIQKQLFRDAIELRARAIFHRRMTEEERQQAKADRLQRLEAARERLTTVVNAKVAIALMEWTMVNGKALGDCTGSDFRRFSGEYRSFFEKLARRLSPRQKARSVFDEDGLQTLFADRQERK